MKAFLILTAIILAAVGVVGLLAMSFVRGGIDPRIEQIGRLDRDKIKESSGIVASRQFPGVFWTHSDKGNAPTIFAVDRSRKLIADFRVEAENDDWEDIATDDLGRLYIGRIGNNDAKEKEIGVYRVEEPDPRLSEKNRKKLKPEKRWRLRFPAKPFDCESLFIHQGQGYVISKVFDGDQAAVYRFDLGGGEKVTLEKVTHLPIRKPVTSASISRDGKRLAVLSWDGIHFFNIDGDVKRAGSVEPAFVSLHSTQAEGITIVEQGVIVTLETGVMYFCPEPDSPRPTGT